MRRSVGASHAPRRPAPGLTTAAQGSLRPAIQACEISVLWQRRELREGWLPRRQVWPAARLAEVRPPGASIPHPASAPRRLRLACPSPLRQAPVRPLRWPHEPRQAKRNAGCQSVDRRCLSASIPACNVAMPSLFCPRSTSSLPCNPVAAALHDGDTCALPISSSSAHVDCRYPDRDKALRNTRRRKPARIVVCSSGRATTRTRWHVRYTPAPGRRNRDAKAPWSDRRHMRQSDPDRTCAPMY